MNDSSKIRKLIKSVYIVSTEGRFFFSKIPLFIARCEKQLVNERVL